MVLPTFAVQGGERWTGSPGVRLEGPEGRAKVFKRGLSQQGKERNGAFVSCGVASGSSRCYQRHYRRCGPSAGTDGARASRFPLVAGFARKQPL